MEKQDEYSIKIISALNNDSLSDDIKDKLYCARRKAVDALIAKEATPTWLVKLKRFVTLKTIGGAIIAGATGAYAFNYIYTNESSTATIKEKIQSFNYDGNLVEPKLTK